MDMGTPEPNPGSRELAINLNTSEIIMVDLDMLEENPDELLNVLMGKQPKCKKSISTLGGPVEPMG